MFSLIVAGVIAIQLAAAALFMLSAKKKGDSEYGDYMDSLDYKEFKSCKLLPMGMYICIAYDITEKLPAVLKGAYRRYSYSLKQLVGSVYGTRYEDFYYLAFSALKKVYMLYAYFFVLAVALMLVAQKDPKNALLVNIIGAAAAVSVQFLYDSTLKSKRRKIEDDMRKEFPDFVNKMVLLINAGMTVTKVWQKVATEDTTNSPLMTEVKQTYFDMQNGVGEVAAIDNFGRRCKIKEIMKFATVVSGNIRKGGADIMPVLMQQSEECWAMRCAMAKEQGAKLSSKMVLPIMMLLIAIIIIVAGPAMFSMSGI